MSELDRRRLEALEWALGLPRRVPIFRCDHCGFELPRLRKPRRSERDPYCPRCGYAAFDYDRMAAWPPEAS